MLSHVSIFVSPIVANIPHHARDHYNSRGTIAGEEEYTFCTIFL